MLTNFAHGAEVHHVESTGPNILLVGAVLIVVIAIAYWLNSKFPR